VGQLVPEDYKSRNIAVATIDMRPDNLRSNVWWLHWVELDEVVARIDMDLEGSCCITPQGRHWSPMKSIGKLFDSPASALREVRLYFERR
jgi:hypothetical protein